MYISIPPKYAVAQVIGFIKGKSAIHIARIFGGRAPNFTERSRERGYFASTVGRDEKVISEYIKRQEAEDKRLDQMKLLEWPPSGGSRFANPLDAVHIFQASGFAGGH